MGATRKRTRSSSDSMPDPTSLGWATVLSPDASRAFVDREHLAPAATSRPPRSTVESRNQTHAARGADDHLSTWKVVTRSVGDSSAPKSVFSSRICAESMERIWSPAGATSGNRWQMNRPRKRLKQAKTVAVGCDPLPLNLDGKEGVDGSSPSEGSAKAPQIRTFLCVFS